MDQFRSITLVHIMSFLPVQPSITLHDHIRDLHVSGRALDEAKNIYLIEEDDASAAIAVTRVMATFGIPAAGTRTAVGWLVYPTTTLGADYFQYEASVQEAEANSNDLRWE